MKTWLSTKGPLITTMSIYPDFLLYQSGVYIKREVEVLGRDLNVKLGGHCVCVIGYDETKQAWLCKNSWGSQWGEDGFCWIGYSQIGIDAQMWGINGFKQVYQC
jgi:C1A family cysteine protease